MSEIKRRRLSAKERKEVYKKCGGRCAYCGCEIAFRGFNVEHVKPLSLCGSDTLDNMLPSCRSCNHYKSTLDLEGYRGWLGGLHSRMLHNNVNYKTLDRYGLIVHKPEPVKFYFEIMEGNNNAD